MIDQQNNSVVKQPKDKSQEIFYVKIKMVNVFV